ncbi:MAG: T9SS type A sorting domain-containing protein [Bacteroidia bacterium]
MRIKSTFVILLFIVSLGSLGQAPNWSWVKGATVSSSGQGVVTDNSGNVFFTGTNQAGFVIDTYTMTSGGSFLAKADGNGNIIWIKNLIYATSRGIALDANNNIYVTGNYGGGAYFGSVFLGSFGFNNIFVAKYDQNGNVLWAKGAGGDYYNYSNSLTVDASGNAIIVGQFQSTKLNFDSVLVITNSDTSYSSGCTFVAKFDPNGNILWARNSIGNYYTSFSSGEYITNDGSNIFIEGYFDSSTIKFGSVVLNNSNGNEDVFIVKYDANGNAVWGKKIGNTGTEQPGGIVCDPTGNIIACGSFSSSSISVGPFTLTNTTPISYNYTASFYAKYTSSGNVVWAQSKNKSQAMLAATDNLNNIYFSGLFGDTLIFGSTHLNGVSGRNTFFVKKDATGVDLWAKKISTPMIPQTYNNILDPYSMAPDLSGNVYLTGYLYGQDCYFDSIHFANPDTSGASNEMFLAKIGSQNIGISEISKTNPVLIYPNPFTSIVKIHAEGEIGSVYVYNIIGDIIYEDNFKSDSTIIDLQNIPKGIYFIRI